MPRYRLGQTDKNTVVVKFVNQTKKTARVYLGKVLFEVIPPRSFVILDIHSMHGDFPDRSWYCPLRIDMIQLIAENSYNPS